MGCVSELRAKNIPQSSLYLDTFLEKSLIINGNHRSVRFAAVFRFFHDFICGKFYAFP